MNGILIFSILWFIGFTNCANLRVDPLVLISQGLVRGLKSSDGAYSSFLGVPYARVNANNPFGPATEQTEFEEKIFNAFDGSIRCPQNIANDRATLDCLRLNIYVPSEATSKRPLPVLVWIHGGSFEFGYAGYYGVEDLMKQGIIVVAINYRLGPYGFMCLDTPKVPGNQGIKDQYKALQWVRNNIAAFGGNPYQVTLGGDSAGAASVLYQLYADKDKIFNKIIVQSGTPQTSSLFCNSDTEAAIKLASHLGFATNDTEGALDFLAKTSPELVVAATAALNLKFRPCREKSFSGVNNFIETDAFSLTNAKKIKNTPVLIGHTDKEYAGLYNFDSKVDPFEERIRNNFNISEEQIIEAASIVRHYYIGDQQLSEDLLPVIEDFQSDFVFNHPTQRAISNLLNEGANPVYEYLFSYTGNSGLSGAPHSSEMHYLFNVEGAESRNEEDLVLSNRMTSMWGNFIKFGNPTPQGSSVVPISWSPVSPKTRPYLAIDKDIQLKERVFKDRMAFWDLFYSIYGQYNKLLHHCHF